MRATTIAACSLLTISGGFVSAQAPRQPDVGVLQDFGAQQSWGSATATVLHSVTGEPLAGMPVLVQQIIPPDAAAIMVFKTDRDGSAFLTPLFDGVYQVWVEWNNNMSNVEYFEINTATDYSPEVFLFFNPDIDPGSD